jgi:hypothetical protein
MYIKNDYKTVGDVSEVKDTKELRVVKEVISDMIRSNAISFGTGHCVGMSQMIQTALNIRGIKSRLLECRLSICYNNFSPPRIDFIGYEDIASPNEVDTHVVVITETKIPILIDASISHRLPQDCPVVIQSVERNDMDFVCDVDSRENAIKMIYEEKKSQRIAPAIQQSLMDRIQMDLKIEKSIKILMTLNIIGITLASFAFINVMGKLLGLF